MYLSKVAPASAGARLETRGHAHDQYEAVIEDIFGKRGFLGFGGRSGVDYFKSIAWRGVSSFLREAHRDRAGVARSLHVSGQRLDTFVSYLEQGIRTYSLDIEGKNLGDTLFSITHHGVSRSLSKEL